MFIALVRFPDIPLDRDAEFQRWFAWSNRELTGSVGLHGRRLLRTVGGDYAALVEHQSEASFAAMHSAPVVAEIQARLHDIAPESPRATHFEVVSEVATGGCCADGDEGHHQHGTRSPEAGELLAVGPACCQSD